MASASAMGLVCTLVLEALQASSAVTALVPADRITDDLPQRPTYPSIVVESQGELAFNTLGPTAGPKWGSEVHVGVRTLSQWKSDSEINTIRSAVRGALDGLKLSVPGYALPDVLTFDTATPMMKTSVSGITTRECVDEYEITVHQ